MGDNAKSKDKEEGKKLLYEQDQLELDNFKKVSAQQKSGTSIIPSSSGTQLAYRSMLAGKDGLGDLSDRIEGSTRNKNSLTIEQKNKSRKIIQNREKGIDEIEIENIDLIQGGKQSSSVRKMFVYLLSQTAMQALNNGETTKLNIVVSYDDLIKKGMYKNAKTASRGIERAFDALSKIKVKGYASRRGKDKKKEQVEAGVLFYHMKKTGKGSVIISLNENINWDYIAQAYTMLPNTFYALPSNAADLFYYIFYIARQRHEEIKKNNGEFSISYRNIQRFLMLPSENTASKATTQIKNPIEEAIGNILDNVSPNLIELIPDEAEYINITEYLDTRYLRVKLKGEYLKYFTDYFNRIEKTIAADYKRREKNKDIAQQKAIQKMLEAATAADQSEEGQSSAPQSDTQSKDTQ